MLLFTPLTAVSQAVPDEDYPVVATLLSVRFERGCCDYAVVVVGDIQYELQKHSWKGYELGQYAVRIHGSKMFFRGNHNGKPSKREASIVRMDKVSTK